MAKDQHNHHHHNHDHGECHGSCRRHPLLFYSRELAALLLLGVALLLHYSAAGPAWLLPAVCVAGLLPVGLPVVREMIATWRSGSVMNEFTLMVAAAAGAFCIGEYPEALAVLLFYSLGEKMEEKASDDARRRIRSLLSCLPDEATVKDGDRITTADPSTLPPGTVIIVKPGERVPIDGALTGDTAISFDTSAITGESVPRSFAPGAEISSGMIPVDRSVELRTLRPFSDSSMSRIMKMIEEAQASKSPTETMLRRITRWYTPVVFMLAALIFVVPCIAAAAQGMAFEWADWLRRSLVFLVCSCPCALVVSIPLSYFAAIGTASRSGLLFKGARHLDDIRNVDTVVFDKTGTLTTGSFHITSIVAAEGIPEPIVLSVAAALDSESSHPLAKALVEEATRHNYPVPAATDVTTVNHGITGVLNGHRSIAGSRLLMQDKGIEVPRTENSDTEICVASEKRYLGSIFLADTVKPEAREAVAELHRMGIENVEILSGDRRETVEQVALDVDADSFKASLLPTDKQAAVSNLRREGHKVAFAGDGINDAPAIAASDVGISMGRAGTDIAMESSDVVIASDNLMKIPEAIRLSRRVRAVVIENVSFAIGVKVLVMTLGAFGIATLWAAVFADTGVTLLTILYTLLRLARPARHNKDL